MNAKDVQWRMDLLLTAKTLGPAENIDYPEFLAVRSEIYKMLQEMASETRCSHERTILDTDVCWVCGRKANERNTLPAPKSIPETISDLQKSIKGNK